MKQFEEGIWRAFWRTILDIVARILEYKLFGALRKANYINLTDNGDYLQPSVDQIEGKPQKS